MSRVEVRSFILHHQPKLAALSCRTTDPTHISCSPTEDDYLVLANNQIRWAETCFFYFLDFLVTSLVFNVWHLYLNIWKVKDNVITIASQEPQFTIIMPKGKVWGYDTPDLKAIQMPSPVSQSDKHNYTFEVYKLEREGKCVSPKSITERMWVDGWMDRVTEQCLSCFKNLINHLFDHGTGQTFVRRCWSSSLLREKNSDLVWIHQN